MSLQVLRVEPRYRALLANEKVAAREEFLRAFDRGAERVRTATFALTGLAAGGDLMVLRASAHLEDLQAAAALVSDAGLGRQLTAVDVYLGTASAPHA
ncbi:MAG: chlorite dismutase family protein, partial [Elusimicrobia bacterium]|nr:chlorite dismutase family protein [Elusimicrobiota bacterium]